VIDAAVNVVQHYPWLHVGVLGALDTF